MIVIGIDPGVTGAIAFLAHNQLPDVVDLPTVPTEGSIKRRVHGPALRSLIRSRCPAGEPIVVVMEALAGGGRNKDGSSRGNAMSVASQVDSHATIRTTCELLGLEPQVVSPQKWKGWYRIKGVGDTQEARSRDLKGKSLKLARQLHPACLELLKRQGDHNRGEALLIARWGLQNLT